MISQPLLACLLAATHDDPLTRPEVLWGVMGMALAFLVGAGVIYYVGKWRKQTAEGPRDDGAESLTSFRAMYEAGEITEAEYAELKRRMADKVKKSIPASAATTATTTATSTQPSGRPTLDPPTPPPKPPELPPSTPMA